MAAALTVRMEMLVAQRNPVLDSQTGSMLKGRSVSRVANSSAEPARALGRI